MAGAEHFVQRADSSDPTAAFDRNHYYSHPEAYVPTFHNEIAPHISMLVTTMYWDRRFPRLISDEQLASLRAHGNERLVAVADLTCDVRGAVEALSRTSTVDDPFFVYDPNSGVEVAPDGPGVLMLGVDILPAEVRESNGTLRPHSGTSCLSSLCLSSLLFVGLALNPRSRAHSCLGRPRITLAKLCCHSSIRSRCRPRPFRPSSPLPPSLTRASSLQRMRYHSRLMTSAIHG